MILSGRCVLKIAGSECKSFLQKLLTKDLEALSETQSLYGSLLTPQGRYLSDFFIVQTQTGVLLDLPRPHGDAVLRQFSLYRMRMDVQFFLTDQTVGVEPDQDGETDFPPLADLGETCAYKGGFLFRDPRLKSLGLRRILPEEALLFDSQPWDRGDKLYRYSCMANGISQAPQSLLSGSSIILEHGFLELGAISLQKGCYPGQELIARALYRGEIRKRVFPVQIMTEKPGERALSLDPVPPVLFQGQPIGRLLDALQDRGLILASVASVRASILSGELLSCGNVLLKPLIPDWMRLPEESGV